MLALPLTAHKNLPSQVNREPQNNDPWILNYDLLFDLAVLTLVTNIEINWSLSSIRSSSLLKELWWRVELCPHFYGHFEHTREILSKASSFWIKDKISPPAIRGRSRCPLAISTFLQHSGFPVQYFAVLFHQTSYNLAIFSEYSPSGPDWI